MKVVNAMQLKKGVKVERNSLRNLTQPIQFMLTADKDEQWRANNLDWLEMIGMHQIRRNARKFLKNYKLAVGIIDKTDYISVSDNESAELLEVLTKEDESAFELKFYPIIPDIIDLLAGEFAKRSDKIQYKAVDDVSYNELLDSKMKDIEEILVFQAEQKLMTTLQSMGIDLESEEGIQEYQTRFKSLPEIEQFYKKDYISMSEQWANHQHEADEERFKLRELELMAFKDSLIVDREFWHFKLNEDDYDVEIWNPVLTFYHKSPENRYISEGNFVGRLDLMTLPDVIDKFGYMMTKEQLECLERVYPAFAAAYNIPGVPNDGSFYDATKSHEWNTEGPSLAMRQYLAFNQLVSGYGGDDILLKILSESEDVIDFSDMSMIRVTTAYWKSQRLIGRLTKIDETGMVTESIVDENYKVTVKPVYDNTVKKEKCKETLVFGEHIDWAWINETWSGIKIGPNRPSHYGNNDTNFGFDPIYLNVKPLKFQLKGDYNLYNCKLPVEGAVFTDRNTRSISLVDRLKPYQIGFNMVNNQIADILIDELGSIILLDKNTLPDRSLEEDFGPNPYAKSYSIMKDFSMLPVDTSAKNTQNNINFQHYQVLDLQQTNRLLGRIQYANYFKSQAYEAIGITPQRMGAVKSSESATGTEVAVNNSYARTEMLFVRHSEHLMPRVHKMRTDIAQFYNSVNPSLRLSYLTSTEERINFEMNGTDLLLSDINVYCTSKVNHRQILDTMKQLAINNNTSGASIYDLGQIIKSNSLAEVEHALKAIDLKAQKQTEEERIHENNLLQEQAKIEAEKLAAERAYDAAENEKDRMSSERIAEIRAAGYTAMTDFNEDGQSDFISTLEYLDDKNRKDRELNNKINSDMRKAQTEREKVALKEKEIASRERMKNIDLKIAKENKQKHEVNKKK